MANRSPDSPEPGLLRSLWVAALTESGVTRPAAASTLFAGFPATTFSSPFMRASKPCSATFAGSSCIDSSDPARVSSISARSEEVRPRHARQKRCDGHAAVLQLAADGLGERLVEGLGGGVHGLVAAPGWVAAIDEVTSTLPEPRSTMSGMIRLARCTVDVTLTAMTSSSLRRSVSSNGPPLPTPALSASASTGLPAARTCSTSCSQPSYVERSARTGRTCEPNARRTSAAVSIPGSSAATTTSKSCSANSLGQLEADAARRAGDDRQRPVARARPGGRMWSWGGHVALASPGDAVAAPAPPSRRVNRSRAAP